MKVLGFEHNDNASGTSLQGYVATTYAELVEQFGEPTFTNGDKVTAEWCLDIKVVRDGELDEDFDYVTATIYDWKEYETPMGRYQWHIGGENYEAVVAVLGAMKETV
jgi:hypothetical protein